MHVGMTVDDAPPTGGFDEPEPEGAVAVVELRGAVVVTDPLSVTDAVLLAGPVVEPEPAVTPPGAAIPAEPSGS